MARVNRFHTARRRFNPMTGVLVFSTMLGMACSDHTMSPKGIEAPTASFSTSARPIEFGTSVQSNTTVHWNEVARSLVASHNTNGPMASRVYALVSVAQFSAVLAADDRGHGHDSDKHDNNGTVVHDAIAKASADVLTALYPDAASAVIIAGAQRNGPTSPDRQQSSHDNRPSGTAIGAGVARAVLARAATDGSAAANCPATPPTPASQFWHDDAVPPNPQALLPCFGNVRTWLPLDVKQFRAGPPPAFGSPAFLQGLAEVRQISDTRTPAILAIVDKWLDGNNSFQPPGRWNLIASDLITRHHLDDADAAQVMAVLNIAMMDTHVACWDRKFTYWESRPWMVDPLITTPRGQPHHPANPSGHACAGGAGSGALAGFFHAERDSLFALGDEEGFSTVQAGVHFRFDVDKGLEIGRTIAAKAVALRDLDDLLESFTRR
jgi:hypothetical protein